MKIMANLQSNAPHRPWRPDSPGKNPLQMDRFELQQEVWDSQREVANLRAKIQSGQTTAVAGMGVLFTSLGIMAAQSMLTGGLSALQMAPVAVGAATGVGIFATGLWKRDSNEMNLTEARFNAEHLKAVYDQRFPT
ncbi:hypothetical protein JST97_32925 [bacterium]|nr:hypothetical protein [bacterium]